MCQIPSQKLQNPEVLNLKRTWRQLVRSLVICFFCMTLLTSTTYAYMTNRQYDSEAEDLAAAQQAAPQGEMQLLWSSDFNKPLEQWIPVENGPLFYSSGGGGWEPGQAQVRYLNAQLRDADGAANLGYKITAVDLEPLEGEVTHLAQVIDVYFIDNIEGPISRSQLNENNYVGTLAELYVGNKTALGTFGENPKNAALVFKMRDNAGPEYVGKSQSFNLIFDRTTIVNSADDIQDAIDNGEGNITLGGDIDLNDLLNP